MRLTGSHQPSWLVLGQSFNVGWQATCDGRSLGSPRPIDGYANGWLAPAGCAAVAFHFAPQSEADAGYLASGLICLALLVLLIAGWPAIRRRHDPVIEGPVLPDALVRGVRPTRALVAAAAGAVLIAGMFALRAGVVAFPLLAFVLWRGFAPTRLTLAAAGLLGIVVPIIYAVVQVPNLGGYNFDYGNLLLGAHWVGLAAIVLLLIADLHMIRAARRAQAGPSSPTNTARAEYSNQS